MADELRVLDPPARPSVPRGKWVPGAVKNLSGVNSGNRVKILALRMKNPARNHLHEQGFSENEQALVLHNDHCGRVMLRVRDEVFLLGRQETPRIEVREYRFEKLPE